MEFAKLEIPPKVGSLGDCFLFFMCYYIPCMGRDASLIVVAAFPSK